MKINLDQLAKEIREMTTRSKIFTVLKDELSKRGYWKNRPRGNPKKGYEVMKGKK